MSTQDRFNQRLKESAMSEQKHEKGKGVIKEEYSLLFGETVTIGKKSYKELLQQVAELTKENERLKEDSNKDLFVIGSQLQQIESLTEQVEGLNKVIDVQTRMLASKQFETPELDRLRERENELVEALKKEIAICDEVVDRMSAAGAAPHTKHFREKLKALLSKFEVPNQS